MPLEIKTGIPLTYCFEPIECGSPPYIAPDAYLNQITSSIEGLGNNMHYLFSQLPSNTNGLYRSVLGYSAGRVETSPVPSGTEFEIGVIACTCAINSQYNKVFGALLVQRVAENITISGVPVLTEMTRLTIEATDLSTTEILLELKDAPLTQPYQQAWPTLGALSSVFVDHEWPATFLPAAGSLGGAIFVIRLYGRHIYSGPITQSWFNLNKPRNYTSGLVGLNFYQYKDCT